MKKPSAKLIETRRRLAELRAKYENKEKRKNRAELKEARLRNQTRIESENELLAFFSPDELEAYALIEEVQNRADAIFAEQLKPRPSQSTMFHEARMIRYLASLARWALLSQVRERSDSEGEDWKQ